MDKSKAIRVLCFQLLAPLTALHVFNAANADPNAYPLTPSFPGGVILNPDIKTIKDGYVAYVVDASNGKVLIVAGQGTIGVDGAAFSGQAVIKNGLHADMAAFAGMDPSNPHVVGGGMRIKDGKAILSAREPWSRHCNQPLLRKNMGLDGHGFVNEPAVRVKAVQAVSNHIQMPIDAPPIPEGMRFEYNRIRQEFGLAETFDEFQASRANLNVQPRMVASSSPRISRPLPNQPRPVNSMPKATTMRSCRTPISARPSGLVRTLGPGFAVEAGLGFLQGAHADVVSEGGYALPRGAVDGIGFEAGQLARSATGYETTVVPGSAVHPMFDRHGAAHEPMHLERLSAELRRVVNASIPDSLHGYVDGSFDILRNSMTIGYEAMAAFW